MEKLPDGSKVKIKAAKSEWQPGCPDLQDPVSVTNRALFS